MRPGSSLEGVLLLFPLASAFLGNQASSWTFLARSPAFHSWQSRSRQNDVGQFRSPRQRQLYCDKYHPQSSLPTFRSEGRVRCETHLAATSQSNEDAGENIETTGGASEEEVSIRPGPDLTGPEVNPASGVAETSAVQPGAVEGDNNRSRARERGKEHGGEEGETVFLPTGTGNDLRLFRAKLRAGSEDKWQEQLRRNVNTLQLEEQEAWAHELGAPEKGCLIMARSDVFSVTQTYFNQAVIFLASHDENGSAGFILNRPTSMRLGELLEGDALPWFRENPLYLGGDVGEGNVQIVHPFGPDRLAGAMEIIPGVCIGGSIEEAGHMVTAGGAKRDDFRFFLHLCGWAPGQLEAEIERGVWFPAATSSNVIMKHCLQLPTPLWREVMTLMGPKYGLLARDTYDDL